MLSLEEQVAVLKNALASAVDALRQENVRYIDIEVLNSAFDKGLIDESYIESWVDQNKTNNELIEELETLKHDRLWHSMDSCPTMVPVLFLTERRVTNPNGCKPRQHTGYKTENDITVLGGALSFDMPKIIGWQHLPPLPAGLEESEEARYGNR